MSIESALKAIVEPILNALAPTVLLSWGPAPKGKAEYVVLSSVSDSAVIEDDFISANKQFTIVTRSGMVRAAEIRDALLSGLQRARGVYAGMEITCISYVRSVELPDASTGEAIIASEYRVNYEGGI